MEIWDLKLTNFTKIYTLRGKRCLMSHIFFGKIGKFGAHSFMSLHPSIVPKLEMINRAAKHIFWLE